MTTSRIERHVVTTLANGSDLAFYVHELTGESSGPTIGICAGVHGNEPTGTLIAHRVLQEFRTVPFRGTLLVLPVANPPAFSVNARHSPLDDLNLNRLFPGNLHGWVSEQLAHCITERFLTKIDVFIDIHSGGDRPTVDYVYIKNTEDLSRAFGSRVLYRAEPEKSGTTFSGTTNAVTESRGVPTVTVELGGGPIDQTTYVERGLRGILNMLRSLDVVSGTPEILPEQVVVDRIETIRPHHGGLLVTAAPPLGERIEQGSIMGEIISAHTGQVLEAIVNPVAHGVMILSHLTINVVQPGDYGYMIGSEVMSK